MFLFLLLLDVPIAPCNATIVPPISCTSLLPFDAVVAPHNATIVPFVSSTFLHPFNVVAAPSIPNWCFPPFMFLHAWKKEQAFPFNFCPPSNFFKPNLKVSLLVTFVFCFDCPYFFE
jgi:hypothetical protein